MVRNSLKHNPSASIMSHLPISPNIPGRAIIVFQPDTPDVLVSVGIAHHKRQERVQERANHRAEID